MAIGTVTHSGPGWEIRDEMVYDTVTEPKYRFSVCIADEPTFTVTQYEQWTDELRGTSVVYLTDAHGNRRTLRGAVGHFPYRVSL